MRAMFVWTIGLLLCTRLCSPLYAAPASAALVDQVTRFVASQSQGLPGEVTVRVRLPASAVLPDCPEFLLAMAPAARPMGRSSVVARCPALADHWSVLIPVDIHVQGSYVVPRHAIPAGQAITADDLGLRQGDLGALPASVLTQPEQAIGQLARSALAAGLPVRAEQLRVREVVRPGQSVTLIAGGAGFEVRNTGTALNGGGAGQVIRVRLGNGQVVSGVATAQGEIRL